MTSVVRPPASAASQICGESQCTWQSTPPGVAISPRPSMTAVAESSTTSIASIVSGLPARPTPTTRPSATPMLVWRTPSTGSSRRTSVIASATPPRSARTASPSRIVPPMPVAIPLAWSSSGSTTRPVSPSATPASRTEVSPFSRPAQRPLARARLVERAVHEPAVPPHHAQACNGHPVEIEGLTGPDHDLRSGLQRRPQAVHGVPVELQPAVDLEQVDVGAQPDRDLAGVARAERPERLAQPRERRLGRKRFGRAAAPDRIVQDDQSHAVAEQRLDLDARHE